MLSATTGQEDVSSQQNATSLQQPRTDLQPTNPSSLDSQSTPQSTPSLSQDQLNTDSLRVGDSQHTIQNTTTAPPNLYYYHHYLNAAWLWLLVPIALAVFLFWPQQKKKDANNQDNTKFDGADVADVTSRPVVKKDKKKKTKNKKR